MKRIIIYFLFILISRLVYSQGQLSGDFQLNANFYDKDTSIGATTTQYLHELSSAESWLYLNYQVSGFTFSARYDLFQNSPLLDPQKAYNGHGISFYSINKRVGKLDITAGSFYDQFGTGMIFRAYEDRILGLDYAIQGVRLRYYFSDNFKLKAFTGKQKYRFETHPQVIKGANLEKDFSIKDKVQFYSGAAFINRTIDKQTMQTIANNINADSLEYRFIPKYNLYAFNVYNNLTFKNISWYIEYAYKSSEAILNKFGTRLINSDGKAIYSSLNYSIKGFGLSLQYKKNEHLTMRTSPFKILLDGVMNYMPPMSKEQAKTLPARYSISAQEFGEEAYQAELTFSPNKKNTFSGNFSFVEDDENTKLFHEIYLDYYRKFSKKLKATIGLQSVYYNKKIYEDHLNTLKDGVTIEAPIVETITSFTEIVYKIQRKKSLRMELQYLLTEQDHGDFFIGLLEFTIAPKYSFSVSDMINTKPKKLDDIKHYYNISASYTKNQTRFSIGYMKQVEGIVCTGGVCRVEPAFSGVKFNLTTSF